MFASEHFSPPPPHAIIQPNAKPAHTTTSSTTQSTPLKPRVATQPPLLDNRQRRQHRPLPPQLGPATTPPTSPHPQQHPKSTPARHLHLPRTPHTRLLPIQQKLPRRHRRPHPPRSRKKTRQNHLRLRTPRPPPRQPLTPRPRTRRHRRRTEKTLPPQKR